MSGKILARVSALSLAMLLAACGGDGDSTPLVNVGGSTGGGSAGNDGQGEEGETTPEQVVVGSIQIIASPVRLDSSAAARAAITARIKDANGVLLNDIPVNFSVSNGGTLEVTQPRTDQAGVAAATLSTIGDPRNRTITVTAQSGSASATLDIEVSGTSVAITGPTSIALGDIAPLKITLVDAGGNGISGENVTVSTTLGALSASTVTTNNNGIVDVQLNSGSTGGTAEVTVSAYSGSSTVFSTKTVNIAGDSFGFETPTANAEVNLGSQQPVVVQWLIDGQPVPDGTQILFTATNGSTIPADGLVAAADGKANISISSTSAGITTVTASDTASGLAANISFEFIATTPTKINVQATKTQLDFGDTSEIIATIRDIEGNLVRNKDINFTIVEDVSGGSLTESRGITDSQGRASSIYQAGSVTSPRDGVVIQAAVSGVDPSNVKLTVARQALRLAIGTGNKIEVPDTVRYRQPYVAIVTDANGAPVKNANIELSVLPVGYIKGSYIYNEGWLISPAQACPAEDANRNGQIDPDDDTNGNGTLEPTNSATTSAASIISGADGSADFSLLYPQSHCNWVKVELTATVRVEGTESVETSEFYLSCSSADLKSEDVQPPGGIEGLYGIAQDCTDPN